MNLLCMHLIFSSITISRSINQKMYCWLASTIIRNLWYYKQGAARGSQCNILRINYLSHEYEKIPYFRWWQREVSMRVVIYWTVRIFVSPSATHGHFCYIKKKRIMTEQANMQGWVCVFSQFHLRSDGTSKLLCGPDSFMKQSFISSLHELIWSCTHLNNRL
jgi:hypothetical protein